jgi:2',5'-phosphodiesterase
VFKRPLAAPHAQFERMLEDSPHLAEALQKVTTIAQISLLVPVAGAEGPQPAQLAGTGSPQPAAAAAADAVLRLCPPLVVVNTHLFFHPYAPHIRSMHTAAMLEEAAAASEVRWEPGGEGGRGRV